MFPIDPQVVFYPTHAVAPYYLLFVANFFLCLSLNLSFHLNNVLHDYRFSKPKFHRITMYLS
jgi:hypothetical protein